MSHELVKLSSKGQLTLPVEVRRRLNLRDGDYLQVAIEQGEVRLRKVEVIQPLSPEDPIWRLIGEGESGLPDISQNHDRYLADAHIERWRRS